MEKEVYAARGAVFLERDEAGEVDKKVSLLLSVLAERNGVEAGDVLSLFFSSTSDIRSRNPATAAREAGWDVPLFSLREAEFEGSRPLVIRVLLEWKAPPGLCPRSAYLAGAEALRPDLA
jgi:chorismate mutase